MDKTLLYHPASLNTYRNSRKVRCLFSLSEIDIADVDHRLSQKFFRTSETSPHNFFDRTQQSPGLNPVLVRQSCWLESPTPQPCRHIVHAAFLNRHIAEYSHIWMLH